MFPLILFYAAFSILFWLKMTVFLMEVGTRGYIPATGNMGQTFHMGMVGRVPGSLTGRHGEETHPMEPPWIPNTPTCQTNKSPPYIKEPNAI
jgi:hypothetical protein